MLPLLLEGGSEFGGQMSEPDLRALELAGGLDSPVRIIPAAAAPDQNHVRAGNNGLRWFRKLGARDVEVAYAIDPASAGDRSIASSLRSARLIYLLGGFPSHLAATLAGSLAWDSVLEAHAGGAVIAGSSAGAMVLCEYFYDPYAKRVVRGLNLLSGVCVLPHHNAGGRGWVEKLTGQLPDTLLVGIDEQTGMLLENGLQQWKVYGAGEVSIYRGGMEVYRRGEGFRL